MTGPSVRRAAARARRARAAACWTLAAAAAPGCARYAPAGSATVPEGARVRVALTPAGTAALARTPVGQGVVGLEGAWAGARGDTVRVRADRLLTRAGVPVAWTGAGDGQGDREVALAVADVQAVERRRTDPGRTALAVAGTAAAGAAFLVLIRVAGRGTGGGSSGGVTPF